MDGMALTYPLDIHDKVDYRSDCLVAVGWWNAWRRGGWHRVRESRGYLARLARPTGGVHVV